MPRRIYRQIIKDVGNDARMISANGEKRILTIIRLFVPPGLRQNLVFESDVSSIIFHDLLSFIFQLLV